MVGRSFQPPPGWTLNSNVAWKDFQRLEAQQLLHLHQDEHRRQRLGNAEARRRGQPESPIM